MKRKRMRLPNGFGQISEIKGRRLRKPFRAMVTVGKTDEGKPIVKLLKPESYFRTYNEAYEALILYHRNPSDQIHNCTMNEVFNMWYEEYKKKDVHPKTLKQVLVSWRHLSVLHSRKMSEVKSIDLKFAIDEMHGTSNMIERAKNLLNMLYDYAVVFEYADKNYARQLKLNIKDETINPHTVYSSEEINILWENKDDPIVKFILIQTYMGWRPQEELNIKLNDIDETNETIIGGSKTEAGINRIVPIHKKIRPIVFSLIKESKETSNSNRLFYMFSSYITFYKRYNRTISRLNLSEDHRPHDGRKTFVTMAKKKGLDEFAIKKIVGHAISDITERVYTDRDIEWLRSELSKL